MLVPLLAVAAVAQPAPPALDGCPEIPWPEPVDPVLGLVDQEVVVRVDVDPAGRTAVRPLEGPEALAEQVVRFLPQCTVRPATLDGLPVPGQIELHWTFPAVVPNVAGVVLRRGDRQPMGGVTVIVGDRSTRTDVDGHFGFIGIPPGETSLRIVAGEVSAPDTPLTVLSGQTATVTVWTFAEQGADNTLIATYSVGPSSDVIVATAADARAQPGSLGDPIRALHAEPALSRTPFDAGWLLVRGGDFDDTATYLDGVPTPLLYHLGGFTSVLHPEMVDRVEFWPDGAPARFGDGLAGAAQVVPADPPTDERLIGGINLVYAEAFAEAPIANGVGFQAAARRSYLDAILGAALGADSARIAPRFYDGAFHVCGNTWSVLALGVSDVFDAPTGDASDVVTITQGGGQLQARARFGRLTVAPFAAERVQQLEEVTDTDTPAGPSVQRIVEWYPGLRTEYDLSGDVVRGAVGVEGLAHTFYLTQGGVRRSAPLFTADPYASFAAGDRVVFRGGIRGDTLFVPGQPARLALSPQSGVTWNISRSFAWKADWGRWHKVPDAVLLVGLPDGEYLSLEQADAASSGFRLSAGPVDGSVDGFIRVSRNLGGFEVDGSLGELLASAGGLETRVAVHQEHWDLSALYTFVDEVRWEQPGAPFTLSPYDRPHRVEIVGVASLPRSFLLSARWRYTSGYPRRDETVAYDVLTGTYRSLGEGDRLAPFHALDLKVVRPFPFRTWRLDASLDVLNVYDRRVPEPVITGFGDPDPAIGFGLPILPVFGLSASGWP